MTRAGRAGQGPLVAVAKQDTAYPGAQRFLASGTTPNRPVTTPHRQVERIPCE
jgi:hypothetical protein